MIQSVMQHIYLVTYKASLPCGLHQIILLDDRHVYMKNMTPASSQLIQLLTRIIPSVSLSLASSHRLTITTKIVLFSRNNTCIEGGPAKVRPIYILMVTFECVG